MLHTKAIKCKPTNAGGMGAASATRLKHLLLSPNIIASHHEFHSFLPSPVGGLYETLGPTMPPPPPPSIAHIPVFRRFCDPLGYRHCLSLSLRPACLLPLAMPPGSCSAWDCQRASNALVGLQVVPQAPRALQRRGFDPVAIESRRVLQYFVVGGRKHLVLYVQGEGGGGGWWCLL